LTFATRLTDAGYATGYHGKYLNDGGMQKICPKPVGDGTLKVPEGWHDFMGACPDTCYVDCTYNLNGESVTYKNASYEFGSNYGTSIVGNASVAFIKRAMAANYPFLAIVATHAPHGPATPAEWYKDLYKHIIAPRTKSFNVSSPDKHWIVATQPELTHKYVEEKIDAFYRNRFRSLRSVDDIVFEAYTAVKEAGQLDRTYFFYTSDHGFHMGQFRLGPCKRQPYDLDLRIPMMVAGPGIGAGIRINALAGIVDIAATFIDIANATQGDFPLDGHSLRPLWIAAGEDTEAKGLQADDRAGIAAWRQAWLVEYFATTGVVTKPPGSDHLKDNSNNSFIGLRIRNASADLAYFEFTDDVSDFKFEADPDFCEAYDLDTDPDQLENICGQFSPNQRKALHEQLRDHYRCKGDSCA